MNLHRLLYLSDATRPLEHAELQALVEGCRDSNERLGITGLLLYSGGHFMQALEGTDMRISSLYTRISRDPRHTTVQKLLLKPVESRLFPDWGMQLVNVDRGSVIDRDRINAMLLRLRCGATDKTSNDALALMQEFRGQLSADAAA